MKNIYQLSAAARVDMMEKVMNAAREKLFEQKLSGLKFKDMAAVMGIPNTRLSEIIRQKYLGERTMNLLVAHGFLSASDVADLSADQKRVFDAIIGQS